MRILFDQGVPVPLRGSLATHEVRTAFEMGWSELTNGDLLRHAATSFDVLVTTDRNLKHQQNLGAIELAVLVLPTTSWPRIREHLPEISSAIDGLHPSDLCELVF